MAFRDWFRRIFRGRRGSRGAWSWKFSPPAGLAGETAPRFHVRVTYPEPSGSQRGAKVILRYEDGTEVSIPDADPLVAEFVRAADRMMRPARWKRLLRIGRL